jgi:hypothetical protein
MKDLSFFLNKIFRPIKCSPTIIENCWHALRRKMMKGWKPIKDGR